VLQTGIVAQLWFQIQGRSHQLACQAAGWSPKLHKDIMFITTFWFICGLTCLIIGAHILVKGASELAFRLGVSPLVVGLTIVALGTSSPEIAISIDAALSGNSEIAVGNVVGSNIFNVLFILGLSAVIAPLVVQLQLIRQEVPLMIGFSILCVVLAQDGSLDRYDGLLLVILMLAYTTFLVLQSKRQNAILRSEVRTGQYASASDLPAKSQPDGAARQRHWAISLLQLAVGLVLLVVGSGWLVESATIIARFFGIADVIIGLTIVAAGTSMPEVATSIIATLKGERDIAIGNVVGSNIFNILACLGISSLVAPQGLDIPGSVLAFDFWVMLAVALICLPIFFSGRTIARWEGFVLLGYYLAYTAYLILAAQDHDALPLYSMSMLLFVLPLSVIALLTSVWSLQKSPADSA
jgi:cation:H+ antiporter